MPRGNLHHAGSQFGVGMFIGHNLETAAGYRLQDFLADCGFVALVFRMDRDCHVRQHRFGAGGCHFDMASAIGKGIAKTPEAALCLAGFDLKVRNRGLQFRVPVDQALVTINQPLVVEIDKDLEHRAVEMRVHGELLVRPVHRTAKAAQLAGNLPAAFGLPLPDDIDKFVAAVIGSLILPLFQLAFDHHLCRDSGMVHADHPQRILALQAGMADQDILQRIIERVADMQAARHIRRRVDDGKGLRIAALWPEGTAALPMLKPFGFDCCRVESLVDSHGPAPYPRFDQRKTPRNRARTCARLLHPLTPRASCTISAPGEMRRTSILRG